MLKPNQWTKSRYSLENGCVEVAPIADSITVRDSKDPAGSKLSFNREEWYNFIRSAKEGEFDLP